MFSLIHLYFHGTVIFIPLDETVSWSATEKLTAILPVILPVMNPCGIPSHGLGAPSLKSESHPWRSYV